jgi:hypothetical protein
MGCMTGREIAKRLSPNRPRIGKDDCVCRLLRFSGFFRGLNHRGSDDLLGVFPYSKLPQGRTLVRLGSEVSRAPTRSLRAPQQAVSESPAVPRGIGWAPRDPSHQAHVDGPHAGCTFQPAPASKRDPNQLRGAGRRDACHGPGVGQIDTARVWRPAATRHALHRGCFLGLIKSVSNKSDFT